ncbi:Flp pilus assembly protein CpaB [Neobacillus sp. D3-1R]|uniref:Flp pilus assembly protein CpaB n=1 Tax=Neobacillus sp. D3-1R TaxID=3445778 RepID=UPI003F9F7BF0
MRSKIVLIVALVMGVITTVLFFNYMKQFDAATVSTTNTVKVVVAKEQIEKNERISASKLELVSMPEKSVHPEALKSIDAAEGKIATSVIVKGEAILSHRLVTEKEEKLFVSRKIREGYRAVSVGVNFNQSVSNLIEPEDDVDVVFSKAKKESATETSVDSVVLLEKARVLAVGRKLVDSEETEEPYVEYSSVTLELKQNDAVKLINSAEQGSIHFILHQRPIEKEKEVKASN